MGGRILILTVSAVMLGALVLSDPTSIFVGSGNWQAVAQHALAAVLVMFAIDLQFVLRGTKLLQRPRDPKSLIAGILLLGAAFIFATLETDFSLAVLLMRGTTEFVLLGTALFLILRSMQGSDQKWIADVLRSGQGQPTMLLLAGILVIISSGMLLRSVDEQAGIAARIAELSCWAGFVAACLFAADAVRMVNSRPVATPHEQDT